MVGVEYERCCGAEINSEVAASFVFAIYVVLTTMLSVCVLCIYDDVFCFKNEFAENCCFLFDMNSLSVNLMKPTE